MTRCESQRFCTRIRIVTELRPGKGIAMQTGFEACKGDYIIALDADGSMDGAEIPNSVMPSTPERSTSKVRGSAKAGDPVTSLPFAALATAVSAF